MLLVHGIYIKSVVTSMKTMVVVMLMALILSEIISDKINVISIISLIMTMHGKE